MSNTVSDRLRRVAGVLEDRFPGKSEIVRLLLVAVVAREHAVIVGPPGTAKSALLRGLARLLDARYFEYLLTRFTEPNELFGPVDIQAFRAGAYRRRTEGMLPEAEIVFLDEVFKSNSAILNALLGLLNERRTRAGAETVRSPLVSAFGASNEVPSDDGLAALFDRFLLRIRSRDLEAHHFGALVEKGLEQERRSLGEAGDEPILTMDDLRALHRQLTERLTFGDEVLETYKALVFQLRAEGVAFSDRRLVKVLKLVAASALVDGRREADAGDLFVLKHVWNTEEQALILERLVEPVLDEHYRDHPERRRFGALEVTLDTIAAEIDRIRHVLVGGTPPSDLQLFAQLRALGELRAALAGHPDPSARALEQRIAQLLDASLRTDRFSD